MRGKAICTHEELVLPGITPAHAGKGAKLLGFIVETQDHPRACGERLCYKSEIKSLWGSPPRMRGKALKVSHLGRTQGITPAHAGKGFGIQKH